MRRFVIAVVILSVAIPVAWYAYGVHANNHATSSVGGPLTVVYAVAFGVLSDVVLWTLVLVLVVWWVRVYRRSAEAARLAERSASRA